MNKAFLKKLKGYALAPIPNYKPTLMITPEGLFEYKDGKYRKCNIKREKEFGYE